MLETLAERVPMAAKLRIMRAGRAGTLDLDEIDDVDEWFFARRYLQVKRLRSQIRDLRAVSERRRQSGGLQLW
jgi:hypothetical protein